jgi:prepilin-type N-terminal cleavage/methylation domain-containing protein
MADSSHPIRPTRAPGSASHIIRRAAPAWVGGPGHAPCGRAMVRPRARREALQGSNPDGQEGFTLVELLVVVLVLATLVGIAVPTFADQRSSAWDAAVRSELRAASIALESSRSQNGIYELAALTEEDWGFQSSRSVELRHDITATNYCLIGWYAPDADPSSPDTSVAPLTDGVSGTARLWGATRSGVVADVGDVGEFCP